MMEQALYALLSGLVDCPVSPLFGTDGIPCVTYSIRPISGGVVKESQAEIRVIDRNYDQALSRTDSIVQKLDMKQNQPNQVVGNVVFLSALAGGGELFDPETGAFEITRYFTLRWREKNGIKR